jgi:hypothetical protein
MATRDTAMIKPKTITITRAEGPTRECGRPRTVGSWAEADGVLFQWSRTAPEHGGYDKCDFKVVFADGTDYDGRYDLVHHRKEMPNLARHVRSFVRYLAGELPPWCHKPKDIERVRRHQQSLGAETKADALKFLETYDLGVF